MFAYYDSCHILFVWTVVVQDPMTIFSTQLECFPLQKVCLLCLIYMNSYTVHPVHSLLSLYPSLSVYFPLSPDTLTSTPSSHRQSL